MSSLPLLSHRLFAAATQQRPPRRRSIPERRQERFTGLAAAAPVELLNSVAGPAAATPHSPALALALT